MYPRIIRATVPGPLFVLLLLPLLGMAACGSAATPCHPSGTTTGTWPQANDDYANTRDAAASRLSSHNVNQLCVAWTFQVSGIAASGALATSQIVQSGIVYLQDLQSNVYAINLTSGTLKW